jgi:hypothetical protein
MERRDDRLEAQAPHLRELDVRPGSLDREKGTVEVIASTGARVRRMGFSSDYDEELTMNEAAVDLTRLRSVGPVLDNHSAYGSVLNTLGIVEDARVEDRKLVARLRFDLADQRASEVFGKIERGILRAVSLGYDATYERIRAKDRDDGINDVDLFRSTRLEPYEVSVVSMPADAAATFRSAADSRSRPLILCVNCPPTIMRFAVPTRLVCTLLVRCTWRPIAQGFESIRPVHLRWENSETFVSVGNRSMHPRRIRPWIIAWSILAMNASVQPPCVPFLHETFGWSSVIGSIW